MLKHTKSCCDYRRTENLLLADNCSCQWRKCLASRQSAASKLTRFSPRKIPFPPFGFESEQPTQSAKKINCSAKSALRIMIYPIAMPILGKRAAMISRPFSSAFQLIFKMFLCPANFHCREAEKEFDLHNGLKALMLSKSIAFPDTAPSVFIGTNTLPSVIDSNDTLPIADSVRCPY